MKRRIQAAVPVFLILITAAAAVAVNPVGAKGFNEKFEFTGVTFPDGTEGTIRAAVKSKNNGSTAVASYFTTDESYLGQYQEVDGFASSDPDAVRQWALDHYGDRQP